MDGAEDDEDRQDDDDGDCDDCCSAHGPPVPLLGTDETKMTAAAIIRVWS